MSGLSLVAASGGHSPVAVSGLLIAVARGHADSVTLWDLPGPKIESMAPVLAGRFLTTGPPGKF